MVCHSQAYVVISVASHVFLGLHVCAGLCVCWWPPASTALVELTCVPIAARNGMLGNCGRGQVFLFVS